MAFVLPYTFLPNTKIESAKVNANFNAIAHALSGNLRDENIADDADIKATKVQESETVIELQQTVSDINIDHWMTY